MKRLPWTLISFLELATPLWRRSCPVFDCTPSSDKITLLLADGACSAFRSADETPRACVRPPRRMRA
eukprot:3961822-Pleurochrysis_carterae.AAC.1